MFCFTACSEKLWDCVNLDYVDFISVYDKVEKPYQSFFLWDESGGRSSGLFPGTRYYDDYNYVL